MSRVIGIGALVLAGLLLVLAGGLTWLLGTESGTRLAVGQARALLPAGIEFGAVSGRLGGELVVHDLVVEQATMRVEVSRVWLRWSPLALGDGNLVVHEIGARGVRYQGREAELPPEPAAEPFRLPESVSLPLAIRVAALRVEEVEVSGPETAEPLRVDRLALDDVAFVDSVLEMGWLEAAGPMFSVSGSANVTASADYPVAGDFAWRLELPGYAPFDGDTRIGGSLARLTLSQRLAEPYNLQLEGLVADALDPDTELSLDARLDVTGLRLAAVAESLPDATLSFAAGIDGPVSALQLGVEASGTDPLQRRFSGHLQARIEPETVTIDSIRVHQPERDGRLDGRGTVALAGDPVADLTIGWRALTWPLTGEPAVRSPSGTLVLKGPLNDYRLNLEARFEPVQAPALDLALRGRGSQERITLAFDADSSAGRAEGDIEGAWGGAVNVTLALRASEVDPSVVSADWPGRIDLTLDGSARVEGEDIQAEVNDLVAGGVLRGQPLAANADLRYQQQASGFAVDISRFDGRYGSSRFEASGRVDDQADLHWQLASDDLSVLAPGLAGRVSGSGTVSGPIPEARVAMAVAAADLEYQSNRLEELSLSADVDLSGAAHSELSLTARGAAAGETRIARLDLNASGTAAEHRLSLSAASSMADLSLGVEGTLSEPWSDSMTWRGVLGAGEVTAPGLEPWQLERSEPMTVAADRVRIEAQCWRSADARLCASGARAADGLQGALELTGLRYAQLAALLPEGLDLQGAIDGSARVSYPAVGPTLAGIDLRTDQGTISGELEVAADTDQGANGNAMTPLAERPATGSFQIRVPDLAFAGDLAPGVENVQGRIDGDLTLSGSLGQPLLGGTLRLADGGATVLEPGLLLEDLTVTVEGRGRDGIDLDARVRSGGGELRLDGTLSPIGAVPTAQLSLAGSEFQVVNNADGRIFLSPDLTVSASTERIDVAGSVTIPRADITPENRPPSAVSVSPDQVLLSDEPEQQAAPRPLYADVRVVLGDQVQFEGFGLQARFGGAVEVRQEPDSPATATGEIVIEEGEYRAYGQGLVIESGRVFFAGGPVTRPGLDFRAVRRPEEGILVGANVGGTLQVPTFELFSEPSMTEQEQLSYLILGRSLQDSSEGEASALNQAVLAMGLKGGDFLARNIGQRIGVDEIGVQTGSGEAGGPSDPENASLVVGKYLSPSLYVSYGIGLFDPESVLKLQYEISRRWKVVTESSGEVTGADVLYTIERGR